MNQIGFKDVQIQNEVTFFPASYYPTIYVTPSFGQTHVPWPIYKHMDETFFSYLCPYTILEYVD